MTVNTLLVVLAICAGATLLINLYYLARATKVGPIGPRPGVSHPKEGEYGGEGKAYLRMTPNPRDFLFTVDGEEVSIPITDVAIRQSAEDMRTRVQLEVLVDQVDVEALPGDVEVVRKWLRGSRE